MAGVITFLQAHPLLTAMLGATAALAAVGLWYVVANHLKAILTTLLSATGAAAGAVVFWRGVTHELTELLVIGVFLMLVFPVMFMQAVRRERKPLDAKMKIPHVVGVGRQGQSSAATTAINKD